MDDEKKNSEKLIIEKSQYQEKGTGSAENDRGIGL